MSGSVPPVRPGAVWSRLAGSASFETPQWLRNKYGTHVVVNVDWKPGDESAVANEVLVENTGTATVGEGSSAAGTSTPSAQSAAQTSTPDLDRSAPSTKDLNTRRLGTKAPRPSWCFKNERVGSEAATSRQRSERQAQCTEHQRCGGSEDLKDPKALQDLYRQAVASGIACSSEAGELNFFALANRARTRGTRPGALFISNLKKRRTHFITIEDEEVGRRMLTELRDGPRERQSAAKKPERRLSEEERIVEVCLQQAKRVAWGLEGVRSCTACEGLEP